MTRYRQFPLLKHSRPYCCNGEMLKLEFVVLCSSWQQCPISWETRTVPRRRQNTATSVDSSRRRTGKSRQQKLRSHSIQYTVLTYRGKSAGVGGRSALKWHRKLIQFLGPPRFPAKHSILSLVTRRSSCRVRYSPRWRDFDTTFPNTSPICTHINLFIA